MIAPLVTVPALRAIGSDLAADSLEIAINGTDLADSQIDGLARATFTPEVYAALVDALIAAAPEQAPTSSSSEDLASTIRELEIVARDPARASGHLAPELAATLAATLRSWAGLLDSTFETPEKLQGALQGHSEAILGLARSLRAHAERRWACA